jgi:hypothetical protein
MDHSLAMGRFDCRTDLEKQSQPLVLRISGDRAQSS